MYQKKWMDRFFACFLAVVMGLSCIPVQALAQEVPLETEITEASEATELPTETEASEVTEAPEEAEVPEETEISEETEAPEETEATEYHSHEDQVFAVWTSGNILPVEAGFYCLGGDVELTEPWTAPEGATLLCLNGYRVWGAECTVGENSVLLLTDCTASGAREVVTGTVTALEIPEARTAADALLPMGEPVLTSESGSVFAGMAESIEKQVRAYAKSIDVAKADEEAALDLAYHGIFNRSALKVGAGHSLTALLINSEMSARFISESCSNGIEVMQKLGETKSYNYGSIIWNGDENRGSYNIRLQPDKKDKTTIISTSGKIIVNNSQANLYDETLAWVGGNVLVSVFLVRKSTTADSVTYDVTVSFKDRFDFRDNNGSAPKDVASLVGSFLFREFDWESTVKFQIKVPNTCSHQMGNYHWTYQQEPKSMVSESGNGFTYNHPTGMGESVIYYKPDKAVRLMHNRPWVLEYTAGSPKSFMLSTTDTRRESYPYLYNYGRSYVALAYYRGKVNDKSKFDYYGVAFKDHFKYSSKNTYTIRLENVIHSDRTNMVYVSVFNETTQTMEMEHIPMTNHYTTVDGKWVLQNEGDNYISGQDLEILYLGNRSSKLTHPSLDLRIWENGKDAGAISRFSKRITKPTCAAKGYTTYNCNQCGYSYQGDFVDPLPHTEVADAAVAPTCTNTGLTEGSHCSVCSAVVVKQETVAALGHAEIPVEGYTATCLEAGLSEGSLCTRCEETVVQQSVIPALGHEKIVDPGYAPTCTETGMSDGWHCGRCEDASEPRKVLPALGHTEKTFPMEAPKCEETGLTEGINCAVCDAILIPRQELPALGHREAIDAGCAPSCVGTGLTEGKHCSVCGKILVAQEEIPALGHTEAMDPAVAPDCTNTGLTEGKHCVTCGQILAPQQGIAALGHTPVTDAAVAPDCVNTGLTEGKHCSVCSEVLLAQQTVPALGHREEKDAAVAPDCINTGLTEGKHCSVCKAVLLAQEVVPALGHTEATDAAVAPDCVSTGLTEGKHCSVCGQVLLAQETVAALGHTEAIDAAVAPTCLETGLTEGKHCAVCEEVLLARETVDALGHTEETDPAVAPSCTETGLTEGQHCAVCGEVLLAQEVVAALGHVEVIDNAVEPTCAETGLTEGSHCEVCNVVFVNQEVVPALGHGYENGTCSRCGQDLYLRLPQAHITLESDQKYTLPLEISPVDLKEKVTFTLEPGGEEVLSIDAQGHITVVADGTAWVEISVTDQGITLQDRCRIDVMEPETLAGISLETRKITTQLFSTDYPVVDVLLEQEIWHRTYGLDRGVAIQAARFEDPKTAEMFELQVLDDRSLKIVPTETALSAPERVEKTYRTVVVVAAMGEEYATQEMTLTVKKTLPKLKAAVEPFNSFYPDQTKTLKITGGTVNHIALDPERNQPDWLTLEGNLLRLTEAAPRKNASGKLHLLVETQEWAVPAAVTVSVKNAYKEPKLILSAKTLALNTSLMDKAEVMVTAKDHDLTSLDFRLTDSEGKLDKTGELDVSNEKGILTVTVMEKTQGNYKLHLSTQGSKETAITVKTTTAEPKVTFRTLGTLDTNLPRQKAELAPAFKNYNGSFTLDSFTAENAKKLDAAEEFALTLENGKIHVSCAEDTPTGNYTLKLQLALADGSVVEGTAKVTVKRTPLKLKLSKTKVTLNKAVGDRVSIAVTGATKGFSPDTILWEGAEEALDICWKDGILTVAVNEETAYGKTYKLTLRAKEDAPAQNLTVSVLAESKSRVSATLKAKGHIDVIRQGSAVTLTASYKNCAGAEALEETLVFRKAEGKEKTDAGHLFACTRNRDGSFTVTQKGPLDPKGKYTVQLVTSLEGLELCRSREISLTVKMGTAKLTLVCEDPVFFAGDKQDRVSFAISSQDPSLNGIARMEIKEKKYQGLLNLHSYADGTFALSASGLTAKTATVTLNIYLEGNETAKPNATLKLKVTLQK